MSRPHTEAGDHLLGERRADCAEGLQRCEVQQLLVRDRVRSELVSQDRRGCAPQVIHDREGRPDAGDDEHAEEGGAPDRRSGPGTATSTATRKDSPWRL